MVEKGLLTPEEARNHPQKNIITRCVGRKKRIRSDILTVDSLEEDVFLLCSDGLNDMLIDESIHQIVTESDDFETSANLLVQAANDKGGKDNITVVLFRLHS
jgi:protein phosphatase